jgi:hypothetical protein
VLRQAGVDDDDRTVRAAAAEGAGDRD